MTHLDEDSLRQQIDFNQRDSRLTVDRWNLGRVGTRGQSHDERGIAITQVEGKSAHLFGRRRYFRSFLATIPIVIGRRLSQRKMSRREQDFTGPVRCLQPREGLLDFLQRKSGVHWLNEFPGARRPA
jgi:hypothetical protein